jgi:hypothetical protein
MHPLLSLVRRAAAALALALPLAASAAPSSYFVAYAGQGNVSVFDTAAGTGGWVGAIDEIPDPGNANPLSLVSFVLFTVDNAAHTLSGQFEFTTTDLLSTLTGDLSGSFVEDDILTRGGQFSIDYRILGGTGQFEGASGFGLAFVDFNPFATGDNNYGETGLLQFNVPAPATLALAGLGLLGLALQRRRAA